MKFSVIIPTYNRAHLLPRAIDSVLAQTLGDFELIIVDDGSVDETFSIVSNYADDRIRYLFHEFNRGQSSANNTGIAAASGEIVSFLDSDDAWVATYLEEVWVGFQQNPTASFIYCRYVGGPPWSLSGSNRYREVLNQGYLSATITLSVKREALIKAGCFNPLYSVCNDDDLCFRLARLYSFYHLPRELAIIYPTPNSMSRHKVAEAEGWERLIHDYRSDIVSQCGSNTYARHCFRVAELMFHAAQLSRGLSLSWEGLTHLLQQPSLNPTLTNQEMLAWLGKLMRAAASGARSTMRRRGWN
jgi:glycosyltransferase involved in cell wall biosynthesis